MTDEAAFPLPSMRLEDGRGYPAQPGLTKREWFAGTLLVDPKEGLPEAQAKIIMGSAPPQWSGTAEDIEFVKWWLTAEARYRFMLADAMIEEGKRKP